MAETYSSQDIESDPRITEARQFLKLASEAESTNRQEAVDDLRFASGDQWPVEIQNSRNLEARPCLTINKIDSYVRQVTNQQRQQRPRIKVHPVNNVADAKVAEIITGITRHIEVNSDADTAYDTAFDSAVRMGWGYFRIITDYVSEDSFDQEIFINHIDNPFTVYFDPNSVNPDGSDAEKCLITEVIAKDKFRKLYPNADDGGNFRDAGTGDSLSEWIMKDDIRIAEYFYTKRKKAKLVLLSTGDNVWEDELPDESVLAASGVEIISARDSFKKSIHWCKVTGLEVLEEGEWPGKYIPVVPVYGQQVIIDDKRKRFGLVRMAKDPQKMYNYWQTTMTESVALAPKAKWILAEGQDENHEDEWAQANIKSMPVLRYKQTDIEGRPAPPPQRLQPEPPPAGVMAAAATINQDLQSVLGIFDPSQMPSGNMSGKAIAGQQQQVDLSNFHYFDNLTRSIKQTGRIILDLIPKIYDSQRVMRIIGDDGQPDTVTINERKQDEMGVMKVLNDVTIGRYDVVMDTGPAYNTKRIEAVDAMMPLIQGNQELFNIAGDLVFRNMDFPGANVIADRLASINPLAQIDDKSDVPPQVQMQLRQMKQQNDEMAQQLQQLQMVIKQRQDIEQVKQDAETKRELMKQTAKTHDVEMQNETKRYDTEMRTSTMAQEAVLKTRTQLEIEELKAQVAILLARMNSEQAKLATAETTERAI